MFDFICNNYCNTFYQFPKQKWRPGRSGRSRKKAGRNRIILVKLENYIKKNTRSGFIKKFYVDMNEVYVWRVIWDRVNVDLKNNFVVNLAHYCDLKGSTGRITIYDYRSGKELASFSQFSGFKIK